MLIAHLARRLW